MNDDPHFPLPDVTWAPAQPFWEAAARHELHLPRCDRCAALNAVGDIECRLCAHATFTWERMSGHATLYSWTLVRRPFLPQLADQVPFLTGLVNVDEEPSVRLATRLVDCEQSELRIHLPLEVVFEPLPFAGPTVIAPYFRPRRS